MALERVPADIRKDGGVARMSDPDMIQKIKKAVTIPVMAKVRHPETGCWKGATQCVAAGLPALCAAAWLHTVAALGRLQRTWHAA